MQAVITGDLVNSSSTSVELWIPNLKSTLNRFGKEKIDWEIFRGDSFQLLIDKEKAFEAAIFIKMIIKEVKHLDVRMAIGIGKVDYRSSTVSESNGEAFVNSGHQFENLKKERLLIKTPSPSFDHRFNVVFSLVNFFADQWSVTEARTLSKAFVHRQSNQKELAELLSKSQSTISATLQRSGYEEIEKVLDLYQQEVKYLEESPKGI